MRKMQQEGKLADLSDNDRRYLKALMEYRVHKHHNITPLLVVIIIAILLLAGGNRMDGPGICIAIGASCALTYNGYAILRAVNAHNNGGVKLHKNN